MREAPMRKAIIRFWADTRGSAAIEYSLLAGALALCVIGLVVSLTETLGGLFQTIISGIASIGGASG
jgi:Flp pilus assembly pilin Flp